MGTPRYSVVAGISFRDGKLLMGRRKDGRFSGYWEFPGGKIEIGEDEFTALQREFVEELHTKISRSKPYRKLSWEYPDRIIDLHFHFVDLTDESWHGKALEAHSELKWFSPGEALDLDLLPANRQILEELLKSPPSEPLFQ